MSPQVNVPSGDSVVSPSMTQRCSSQCLQELVLGSPGDHKARDTHRSGPMVCSQSFSVVGAALVLFRPILSGFKHKITAAASVVHNSARLAKPPGGWCIITSWWWQSITLPHLPHRKDPGDKERFWSGSKEGDDVDHDWRDTNSSGCSHDGGTRGPALS